MTSPTNRTDEVARQKVADFVFRKFGHACDGNHPKSDDCGTCECVEQVLEFVASAITSAVAEERERAAVIAENYHAPSCVTSIDGMNIATIIRQTPTEEGV